MGKRQKLMISLAIMLLMTTIVQPALGQVEIVLEPDHLLGSDTLWVDVRMKTVADSLPEPVWAFQFRVVTDFGSRFIRSIPAYSLSGKSGWLADFNADNGLVGGFSSRSDAISASGVLIRLQFLQSGTDTPGKIELQEFRLNTGVPDHFPAVPSLRLDMVEHLE